MSGRWMYLGCAIALLAAGCSGGGTATSEPTVSAAPFTPVPASAPAGTAGTVATPVSAIGTRAITDDNRPLEVTLNEVRVRAKLMTVTWTVRNVGTVDPATVSGNQSRGPSWSVRNFFGDQIYQRLSDGGVEFDAADGVAVIDPENAKRYLVARSADGRCVCSTTTRGGSVKAGDSLVLSAVYQAPPDTVTTVDVAIPKVPTFVDVPITR